MPAILGLTGSTQGDSLGTITRLYLQPFAQMGFEVIEINISEPDPIPKLQAALDTKDIYFAFSLAAIGRDILLTDAYGNSQTIWHNRNIPFITIHGDSPAYYFDRHVNESANCATLYLYREHYHYRKQLPKLIGLFGLCPVFPFDPVPFESVDFKAKENGKLYFMKNGGDPEQLKALWKAKLPPAVADILLEMADGLAGNLETDLGGDLDALLLAFFQSKGMDITHLTHLRLICNAQLDDYMRRVKSTMIAEVLRDFPVEIHGMGWDHLDVSGKPCKLVTRVDYLASHQMMRNGLGVIDMSPNTQSGFHDRLSRSFSAYTLCVTNEQQSITEMMGGVVPKSCYQFNRESIADTVADVLAHPKQYVELGIEMARAFAQQMPESAAVSQLIYIADTLRLASRTEPMLDLQDPLFWPPKSVPA